MSSKSRAVALLAAAFLLLVYRLLSSNTYHVGTLKIHDGSLDADGVSLESTSRNYTRTLVVATVMGSYIAWIDEELGDLLGPRSGFRTAIYVANDQSAPLHPPVNKGNEAMIYLTYIIEHYENLPDIAIFTHDNRFTWHNNELMDEDLAGMIRYLVPEKVIKDGYVNLRCHWNPGCPDWLHPHEGAEEDEEKQEEKVISERWHELFPLDQMPRVLSQPCCSQFAVSKEYMLRVPRQQYVNLRDWIIETPEDNYHTGRVFEYLWQYVWTRTTVVCPAMHLCYCEVYGLCFGGSEPFQAWFKLQYDSRELETRLRNARYRTHNSEEESALHELELAILKMQSQMRKLKDDAFLRGRSEKARALEATLG